MLKYQILSSFKGVETKSRNLTFGNNRKPEGVDFKHKPGDLTTQTYFYGYFSQCGYPNEFGRYKTKFMKSLAPSKREKIAKHRPLLNFCDMEPRRREILDYGRLLGGLWAGDTSFFTHDIATGKCSYADYLTMRAILDRKILTEGNEKLDMYCSFINPVSLITAPIAENKIIMLSDNPKLSKIAFPGTGLLTIDFLSGCVKEDYEIKINLNTLIEQELVKNTGISEWAPESGNLLMVARDNFKGAERSAGIMSVLKCSTTVEKLQTSKENSKSSPKGRHIISLPADDPELFSALISCDRNFGAEALPEKYATKIVGLKSRNITTTPKTGLMLFELGEFLFGESWYREERKKHSTQLRLYDLWEPEEDNHFIEF